jgi:hypothetical protein
VTGLTTARYHHDKTAFYVTCIGLIYIIQPVLNPLCARSAATADFFYYLSPSSGIIPALQE